MSVLSQPADYRYNVRLSRTVPEYFTEGLETVDDDDPYQFRALSMEVSEDAEEPEVCFRLTPTSKVTVPESDVAAIRPLSHQ